jgi:outer membrane protein TolC
LQEELARRSASTEIQRSYDGYVSSLNQYKKFVIASSKARQSYDLQSKDFSGALITTIDLLQSQETWLDALRQRNTAEAQAWIDWLGLQVTSGILP